MLILAFFLLRNISCNYFGIEYFQLGNTINMKAIIGEKKVTEKIFEIDLNSKITYMSRMFTKGGQGKVIEEGKYFFEGREKEFYYKLSTIPITFNDNTSKIDDFYYYYFYSQLAPSYDCFGLSYKFDEERFNFVNRLYQSGRITDPIFTFNQSSDMRGNIFFGGFPHFHIEGKKHRASCKVIEGQSNWSCKLNKVIMGDKEFINKDKMVFQSKKMHTIIPQSFRKWIISNFFQEYIDKNECRFTQGWATYLTCACEVFDKIPDIVIVFEEFGLNLKRSLLISENSLYCSLTFNYYNEESSNEWMFGIDFFQTYPVVFDYRGYVTIYNDEEFKTAAHSSISSKKTPFHCIIIIFSVLIGNLSLMSLILIFLKLKKSDR